MDQKKIDYSAASAAGIDEIRKRLYILDWKRRECVERIGTQKDLGGCCNLADAADQLARVLACYADFFASKNTWGEPKEVRQERFYKPWQELAKALAVPYSEEEKERWRWQWENPNHYRESPSNYGEHRSEWD